MEKAASKDPRNLAQKSQQPSVRRTEAVYEPSEEQNKDLSTTIHVHASFRLRAVIVGVNLTIMLLSLVAFWCAAYPMLVRSSQRNRLLHNLTSKSFSFTLLMHLDTCIIALSVALGALSACGMVGALRENIAVLDVYQTLLAILIVLTSLLAIAVTMAPTSIRNHIKDGAYVEFIQGYRHSEYFQYMIDALQTSLHCCGFSVDTFHDWEENEYFRCETGNPSNERCSVPISCCRSRVLGVNGSEPVVAPRFCGYGVLLMEEQEAWKHVYTRSCADAALTYVVDNVVTYVGLGMLFNMFLLTMLITSIVLQDHLHAISTIYNAYYTNVIQGQEAMQEAGLIKLPEKPTEQPPEMPAAEKLNEMPKA